MFNYNKPNSKLGKILKGIVKVATAIVSLAGFLNNHPEIAGQAGTIGFILNEAINLTSDGTNEVK